MGCGWSHDEANSASPVPNEDYSRKSTSQTGPVLPGKTVPRVPSAQGKREGTSPQPQLQPSSSEKNKITTSSSSSTKAAEASQPADAEVSVKTTSPSKKELYTQLLPHNFEAIVKDADLPPPINEDDLYTQLYDGIFLNQNRKKYWIEKKSNSNCFMLFARDLSISWAEDTRFWHWPCLKETSSVSVDVAELRNVCWLEVGGRFEISKLSPGVTYKVVFVVMLNDTARGWEIPVNLRLILPDGSKQEHKENLMQKPRGQWIEIQAGELTVVVGGGGGREIEFSLYECEDLQWKQGLVIKGVAIRPKDDSCFN